MTEITYFNDLKNYSEQIMPKYSNELMQAVAIPSISSSIKHQNELTNIANFAKDLLNNYGFSSSIIKTKGGPCVLGTLELNKNSPWLTVYNHLDVQPANEPQWLTDPFKPLLKDGIVIGRGSTDDKGPALAIIHAINFLKTHNIPIPNIQVIYETEEEIGSTHFGSFLDDNLALLKTPESILISDTIFEGEHPAITYKLKGMQRIELELTSGSKDLHSGIFGGACENPLSILISVLAKMVNQKGEILIKEILDKVMPLSDLEKTALNKVASVFDLNKFIQDSGNAKLYIEEPLEILNRIWHKPTIELHGFEGAQYEPNVLKSAISPSIKAKVSLRLVPGQDPLEVVNAISNFVKSIHPNIKVNDLGGQKAAMTPLDNPFMQKAFQACQKGFNKEPLFTGCGGTIGAVPQFQRVFPNKPVILIAQSLMSDGYHAPNEQFELRQAKNGITSLALYIASLVA